MNKYKDKQVETDSKKDKNEQTEQPEKKKNKKAKVEEPDMKKEKGSKSDVHKTKVFPEKGGKWYKPKKFLWKFPLAKGVKIIAIIMIVIMCLCIICICANAGIIMTKYSTKDSIVINALACTFTELAFSILMLIIHVLLFLSTKWKNLKKKNNVLVSWIATQAIWLIHKTCLIFIAMLLFLKVINIGLWIFIFILGIIALVILYYFWMVVYSYWSRLKVPVGSDSGRSPRSTPRASPRATPRVTPRGSPYR